MDLCQDINLKTMTKLNLKNLVADVVRQSRELKNKYTDEIGARVNYACVFSQSDDEFDELKKCAGQIGKVIEETPSGPLFHIQSLNTISGSLKLLKIRKPDKTRPERGDTDFTVSDYRTFKNKYISQNNFKLILREKFEMIELMDPDFNVRAYFSHPPLDKQLDID